MVDVWANVLTCRDHRQLYTLTHHPPGGREGWEGAGTHGRMIEWVCRHAALRNKVGQGSCAAVFCSSLRKLCSGPHVGPGCVTMTMLSCWAKARSRGSLQACLICLLSECSHLLPLTQKNSPQEAHLICSLSSLILSLMISGRPPPTHPPTL